MEMTKAPKAAAANVMPCFNENGLVMLGMENLKNCIFFSLLGAI
jgi:hypothetical protein